MRQTRAPGRGRERMCLSSKSRPLPTSCAPAAPLNAPFSFAGAFCRLARFSLLAALSGVVHRHVALPRFGGLDRMPPL